MDPFVVFECLGAVFGLVIGLIAHEVGHACVAYLNSWSITKIIIGSGPLCFRSSARVDFPVIELRLVPLAGVVFARIPPEATRLQRALFAGGGVLVNFVLLLVGLSNYSFGNGTSTWGGFWLLFSCSQLLLLRNLWPRSRMIYGQKRDSDGLQLWRIVNGHPF